MSDDTNTTVVVSWNGENLPKTRLSRILDYMVNSDLTEEELLDTYGEKRHDRSFLEILKECGYPAA